MRNRYLIVVDMQNDFLTGSLANQSAVEILPGILERMSYYVSQEGDGNVVFTKDTHSMDYLETTEGRNLPVIHCIKGTRGHNLEPNINGWRDFKPHDIIEKSTFGYNHWRDYFKDRPNPEVIELCGTMVSTCVITNALLLKTHFPDARILVNSKLIAGLSKEDLSAAIKVMECCQIEIIN